MESNIEGALADFLEIEALDRDQFLKVKETLTRIGIPANVRSGEKPILWQSCHVLQKRGRYYIVHFKQLFLLDGKARDEDITDEDLDRLEFVACLLEEWNLIKMMCDVDKPQVSVKIIPFCKKNEWDLRSKYTIGVKR